MTHHSSSPRSIVIGGGFCGALTAAQLARRGRDVVLIERNHAVGRGLAYRAGGEELLLNVPAGRMSAFPDRPDDFVNWLKSQSLTGDGHAFVPREWYGRYLQHILHVPAAGILSVVRGSAIDVERIGDRFAVALSGGRRIVGDSLVLALGNAAPRPLLSPPLRSQCLVDDVSSEWRPGVNDTVAIAGTGLTALDALARLRAWGHRGRVILFSRRGRLPIAHTGSAPAGLPALPEQLRRRPTVRHIMTWLRGLASSLQAFGVAPSRAVDALRPITSELWERLSIEERRRFLRHLRPLWDQHRHRAPGAVHDVLTDLRRDGRVDVHAARLLRVRASGGRGLHLDLRRRAGGMPMGLDVDWLLNCTGPERDLTRQRDPLVQALLGRGLVKADELRLGAVTGSGGELIDAGGAIVPDAFVVGGWRMAGLFESTAVPELRAQAARVADRIAVESPAAVRRQLAMA